MSTPCPSCGAAVQASEGDKLVCPACLTEFSVGASRVYPWWDVLLIDGTRTEGLGRYSVRERVYTQRIPINARVRPTGESEWVGIHEVPEFMRIYTLLGVEAPLQAGVRRIAGWRGASEAGPPTPVTAPRPKPKPAPVPVVAEGADVRVVAGHEPEEIEELDLEPEELPVVPFAAVETAPAPRSFPWVLLLIPVALLALLCAGALVWFS